MTQIGYYGEAIVDANGNVRGAGPAPDVHQVSRAELKDCDGTKRDHTFGGEAGGDVVTERAWKRLEGCGRRRAQARDDCCRPTKVVAQVGAQVIRCRLHCGGREGAEGHERSRGLAGVRGAAAEREPECDDTKAAARVPAEGNKR